MARCTLVIEDRPDGRTAVIGTPSFADMARKARTGAILSPAEAMLTLLMKRIYDESKLEKEHGHLILPD